MADGNKKVSFDCPIDVLERLDKLAKRGDIPRSKLIANLVEVGVETLEDCQKILDTGGTRYKIHDPASWPISRRKCRR